MKPAIKVNEPVQAILGTVNSGSGFYEYWIRPNTHLEVCVCTLLDILGIPYIETVSDEVQGIAPRDYDDADYWYVDVPQTMLFQFYTDEPADVPSSLLIEMEEYNRLSSGGRSYWRGWRRRDMTVGFVGKHRAYMMESTRHFLEGLYSDGVRYILCTPSDELTHIS